MSDGEVLRARDIVLRHDARPFAESFRVGEITGIAGLEGHGQARFLATLAGAQLPISGVVERVSGRSTIRITSMKQAVDTGIGYMPPDRKSHGIFPGLSVADNFLLGNGSRMSRLGWIRQRNRRELLARFRHDLAILFSGDAAKIETLSGGNQQKVLLARAMAGRPRIMILDDPTRGVDFVTRRKLFQYFREIATRDGTSFIVLSSEIEEIVNYCDRAIVFHDQTVSARLAKAELSGSRILDAMFDQDAGRERGASESRWA